MPTWTHALHFSVISLAAIRRSLEQGCGPGTGRSLGDLLSAISSELAQMDVCSITRRILSLNMRVHFCELAGVIPTYMDLQLARAFFEEIAERAGAHCLNVLIMIDDLAA